MTKKTAPKYHLLLLGSTKKPLHMKTNGKSMRG